jgi:hypothetical protein
MATKPNKSIKVSQKTIDEVKKMGMAKALKEIKSRANQGQGMGPAGKTMRQEGMKLATNSEFAEAVRRLYGDRRSAAARTQVSPTTSRGPAAAKMASKAVKKASTSYSPRPMSETKKASTSYSPVKKAAPAKKPALGGFSMAAKALGNVGSRVERTPAKQKELAALQAKLKAKRDAKKNK